MTKPKKPRKKAKTSAPMGRPPRLTPAFIAEFCPLLQLGLPLQHAASLCGALASQVSDWLRDGRRDIEAGKRTVYAQFSERVRVTLAELQKAHLSSLVIYQRMAEGWSPRCKTCREREAPCGKHPKNIRLAADLSWRMLSHRFPGDWASSTVRHEVGLGEADGADALGASPAEGTPQTPILATGLVVFLPQRNEIRVPELPSRSHDPEES